MLQEEQLIKNRLLLAEGPLKQLLDSFYHKSTGTGVGSSVDLSNNILLSLEQFKVHVAQLALQERAIMNDVQQYQQEQHRLDEALEVAKTELENLNHELVDAQFELKQRREFDKLAKQILKFPSQEESLNQVELLKAELVALEKDEADYQKQLQIRKNAFIEILQAQQRARNIILYGEQNREASMLDGSGMIEGDGEEDEEEDEDQKQRKMLAAMEAKEAGEVDSVSFHNTPNNNANSTTAAARTTNSREKRREEQEEEEEEEEEEMEMDS